MICLFNKYKKSVQKRTDFFDNSFFNAVPDKPLATRNKPHNNQLCADLSRFISAYPVVSHFLRFAWQTTIKRIKIRLLSINIFLIVRPKALVISTPCSSRQNFCRRNLFRHRFCEHREAHRRNPVLRHGWLSSLSYSLCF